MRLDADELREMYRRCIAARHRLLQQAARDVPQAQMAKQAERLGFRVGSDLAQVGEGELAYIIDAAVYAAASGKASAVVRAAGRMARTGGEPALVARGLAGAWVSAFVVKGHHPDLGLLLEDVLRGGEAWVVDEALAEASDPGSVVVARLGRVQGFCLTSGVVCTLDVAALDLLRGMIRGVDPAAVLDDPRFSEAIWRRALGTD